MDGYRMDRCTMSCSRISDRIDSVYVGLSQRYLAKMLLRRRIRNKESLSNKQRRTEKQKEKTDVTGLSSSY